MDVSVVKHGRGSGRSRTVAKLGLAFGLFGEMKHTQLLHNQLNYFIA